MERIKVASGREHNVYQSKIPNKYLKTPTYLNQLTFFIFNFNPSIIRSEHQEVEKMLSNTQVKTPEYRVFTFHNWKRDDYFKKPWRLLLYRGKGYVILQDKIEHTKPAFNVEKYLESEGLTYLAGRYKRHPDNFRITEDGTVFCIDPTKSNSVSGILDRCGILSKQRYRQITSELNRQLSRIIGKNRN